jgi:hypothetical protein
MSRPRKPTAALEASGAFKRNPQRRAARANEPVPTGPLGNPPSHFNPYHVEIWRELAAQAPPGVLTISDRWVLEICCTLMGKYRRGTATAGEMTRLMDCIRQIELTPSSRSSVSSPKKPKEKANRFARIAATPRPGTRSN